MLNNYIVRVSDVHSRSDVVQLDLIAIIRPLPESASAPPDDFRVSLLYYGDGILAVHATKYSRPDVSHIFAISTAIEPADGRRIVGVVQLSSSSKLFVRHNSRYLYYGTHTGIGDDGHHKWEIEGMSLREGKAFDLPEREKPLLLEEFHGTDIGSTVAFEIHNDYFYAVSNQGTFEVEEIDYTSFYHWVRFPLNNPTPDEVQTDDRLYRRQHKQGPIHDSWTDLTLQIDERTNETVVVESRREWAQASSRQSRTFYVTKIKVPQDTSETPSLIEEDFTGLKLPNDIMTTLIDSTNKVHYMNTPDLYSWSQHPEFAKHESSPRSFILARTKFRAYNYSCTSFLDLVEDDRCCNDPTKPPCLRLRIGSRREKDLEYTIGKQRIDDTEPVFADEASYRHSPIQMWPPLASRCPCSHRLHNILSPPLPSGPTHARSITGVMDERCLVYMVKPGRSYGASNDNALGSIVIVDFSRPVAAATTTPSPAVTMQNHAGSSSSSAGSAGAECGLDPATWQWSPGLEGRCRSRTCQ